MIQRTTILSAILVAMFGCSKKEENPLAPPGTMIAKIGYDGWVSITPSAILANNTLYISGTGSSGKVIKIFLNGKVGTIYPIAGTVVGVIPQNHVAYDFFASSYLAESNVGEVSITEMDEVKGTLSGTFASKVSLGTNVTNIEKGSFTRIPLSVAATSPGSPPSVVTAKINGVDLVSPYSTGVSTFQLQLSFSDGQQIFFLSLPVNVVAGTYDAGEQEVDIHAYVGYTRFYVNTGVIKVSSHDIALKRIEGTFEFTLIRSTDTNPPDGPPIINATLGVFSISYP